MPEIGRKSLRAPVERLVGTGAGGRKRGLAIPAPSALFRMVPVFKLTDFLKEIEPSYGLAASDPSAIFRMAPMFELTDFLKETESSIARQATPCSVLSPATAPLF